MLTRIENWDTTTKQRNFSDFLLERNARPFVWGENDCALFVADGIEVMTGVDIAVDFRGRYQSEAEALDLIRTLTGGATVEDAAAWCADKFELPELPLVFGAQRGDMAVVMDEGQGRVITGLVHLTGRYVVAPAEQSLKRFPLTAIVRAWHV